MKVRHIRAVLPHDPLFVLRHGRRMLAHTFRGSTWRSWLRLESEREAFRRYRSIRERERDYLDLPDPLPVPPPLDDVPRDTEVVLVPARPARTSS